MMKMMMMMMMMMGVISLIKATYHSNWFLLWNLLTMLSILWWKTSPRKRDHNKLRLIANCLERHRATNSCLSSLWIAVERLALTCDTRCLHWNSNRSTTHTLSHSITRGATRKMPYLLLKIKKYRLQVSFQILCYVKSL